jgi:hypothetical protein
MDLALAWHLIYRSAEELTGLYENTGGDVWIESEPESINSTGSYTLRPSSVFMLLKAGNAPTHRVNRTKCAELLDPHLPPDRALIDNIFSHLTSRLKLSY